MLKMSPMMLSFLQRALQAVGVMNQLIVVPDGQRAIDYLSGKGDYGDREKHPLPALLLLDLNLPLKTGLEVLRWMGTQSALAALPVVVLSSSMQRVDIQSARRLGAQEFFTKPVDPAALKETARVIRERWL
jgi:CheY-like chemotaxis protein